MPAHRGVRVRRLIVGLVVVAGFVVISAASASQVISTSSVSNVSLGVNDKGEAMVSYTADGKTVHVLAWGAVNALAPTPSGTQVAFRLAYDGGYQKYYTDNPALQAAAASLRSLQGRSRVAQAAGDNKQRSALAPRIVTAPNLNPP